MKSLKRSSAFFVTIGCFVFLHLINNIFSPHTSRYGLRENTVNAANNHNPTKIDRREIPWLAMNEQAQVNAELDRGPLPVPVHTLQQYMRWHGNHVLRNESSENLLQRRFAIVYYWCPDRAGNILQNMFNSVIFSIATNRTLLVAYDDSGPNTQQECEQVLQLEPWVPRWVEWSQKLNLNDTDNIPISIPLNVDNLRIERQIKTVIFPQMYDIRGDDLSIHRNPYMWHPLSHWSNPFTGYMYDQYIEAMGQWQNETIYNLYADGIEFVMGMLLKEFFYVEPSLKITVRSDAFSIGLHSRHPSADDIGNYTTQEIACLNQLLPSDNNRTPDTCFVYLMSDRSLTVTLLSDWLVERNCTPLYLEPSNLANLTKVHVAEHGDRAGHGFIEDVKFVSQARSSFIASTFASSSALVSRLTAYNRKMDAWSQGHDVADLPVCELPVRAVSGYDYGPGTPTFYDEVHKPKPEAVTPENATPVDTTTENTTPKDTTTENTASENTIFENTSNLRYRQ